MPESYGEGKTFPPPLIEVSRVRILFASAVISFVWLLHLTTELARFRSTATGPQRDRSGTALNETPLDGAYRTTRHHPRAD